jgi:RNA polymerase subunit RPABC4/transcription elongation factor Spt4
MSKLIKCHSCQAEIASDSKACPKCGSPNKKGGCLKAVFGGFLVVVSVMFLIAAGSTEKGGSESKSETNTDSDVAPVPKKEVAAKPVPKKDDDTASHSIGSGSTSKSAPKTAGEREKLKVKGLYIGMSSKDAADVALNLFKDLKDSSSYLNADGQLKSEMISEFNSNQQRQFFGDELVSIDPIEGTRLTVYGPKENFLLFFNTTETGEVVRIGIGCKLVNLEPDFDIEEFAQKLVNSYKLVLIDPKAVFNAGKRWTELKNDSNSFVKMMMLTKQGNWNCNLSNGVDVSVFRVGRVVVPILLEKTISKAEKDAAEKIEKEKASKKSKAVDSALN